MFEGIETGELVAMLAPVVAIHIGLAAYCVVKIARQGTANLNRALWILVVVLLQFIGSAAFLIFGRRRDV